MEKDENLYTDVPTLVTSTYSRPYTILPFVQSFRKDDVPMASMSNPIL